MRLRVALTALAVPSSVVYAVAFAVAPGAPATRLLPALYYPLYGLYLGAALLIWRRPGVGVVPVVGFAIVFRILAMTDPPSLSSDIYRYAWDGRVQRAGESPYAHPPASEALSHLRDDAIHPRINRPTSRTVYPPGTQVLFLALPDDIDGIRLAMIALDTLTILLLAVLLARLGHDPARVVLYAWCPLAVFEVGNNGHAEAAMLPLLVGAVLAYRSGWVGRSGAMLGGAMAMKLYPALAGVALARERPVRFAVAAGGIVAALYLAYGWSVGDKVLGFLPEYVGSAEDHNIGIRRVVEVAISPVVEQHRRAVAFGVCVAAMIVGAVWIRRAGGPVERSLLRLSGMYLLLLPTALHPWYALWLLPWLCVHPRASWLWLIGALPLSYLKYGAAGGVMPPWVVPLEIGPVLALLALEAWRR